MTDTGATLPMSTEGAEALLAEIRAALGMYAEDPAYAEAPAYEAPPAYDEPVTLDELKEVVESLDIPEDMKESIYEQYEASGEHTTGTVINIIVEDNSVVNEISQDLNIHGEVHGDVIQENTSTVVNATGEGANAAGGDQHGVQSQTGDGQQVGGSNEGVLNQGDNSGQQAGGVADNSGSFTSGDGNVSLDDVSINDSAVGFGEGDTTNQADDTEIYDSYNDKSVTDEYTETNTDSFNEDYTSDAAKTVDIDAHLTDSANYESDEIYDNDGKDIDDSYNEYDGGDDYGMEAGS